MARHTCLLCIHYRFDGNCGKGCNTWLRSINRKPVAWTGKDCGFEPLPWVDETKDGK